MTNIKIRKHEQIRSQCSELHTLSFCRKWRSHQHVSFPVLSSSEPLTWLRTHQHNRSSSVLVESTNKTVPSPPPVTELTSYIKTVVPCDQAGQWQLSNWLLKLRLASSNRQSAVIMQYIGSLCCTSAKGWANMTKHWQMDYQHLPLLDDGAAGSQHSRTNCQCQVQSNSRAELWHLVAAGICRPL